MRRGLLFLTLLLYCAASRPVAVHAADDDVSFHPPETPPEKALDAILRRTKKDTYMHDYLIHRSASVHEKDYANMFSRSFRESVTQAEAQQVRKNCNGSYITGELCGLNFSPVTCTQDFPDTFLYHTRQINRQQAVITYAWPYTSHSAAAYQMIEEDSRWKIDGVLCAEENTRFNWNDMKEDHSSE